MKKPLKPEESQNPSLDAKGIAGERAEEEAKKGQEDRPSTASTVATPAMATPTPQAEENPKTKAAWDNLINAELEPGNLKSTSFDQLDRYQRGTANAVEKMVEAVSLMVMTNNKDSAKFSQLMSNVLVQAANGRVGLKDIEDFIIIASDVHEIPNDKMLAVFHAELDRARADFAQKYPNLPSIQEVSQPPESPPVRIGDSGLPTHIVARAYTENDLGKQLAQSINNAPEIKALSDTVKAFKKTPFKNALSPELSRSINTLDKLLDKATRSEKAIPDKLAKKISKHLSAMGQNENIIGELTAPVKSQDISIEAAIGGVDMPQLAEKVAAATQTATPPIPPPVEPQEVKVADVERVTTEAAKPPKEKEEANVEAIPRATAVPPTEIKGTEEKVKPVSTADGAAERTGPLPNTVEPPNPSRPGLGLFPQFFNAVEGRRNEIREEAKRNFTAQFPGKPLPSRGNDIKLGFIASMRYGYSLAKKEMTAEKTNIYLETGAPEVSEFLKKGSKSTGGSFLSRESLRNFREMFRSGLSTVGFFLGSGVALTVSSVTGGRGKIERARTNVENRINTCQNGLTYIASYLNGTGAQSSKSRVEFLGADLAKKLGSANMEHLDKLLKKVLDHLQEDRDKLARNENLPALEEEYKQGLAVLTKGIINKVTTSTEELQAATVLSDIIGHLEKAAPATSVTNQVVEEQQASSAISDTPAPTQQMEASPEHADTDYLSTIQDQQEMLEALAKQAADLTTAEEKPPKAQEYKDAFEELDRLVEEARAAEQSTIPMIEIPEVPEEKEKEAEVMPSEAEIESFLKDELEENTPKTMIENPKVEQKEPLSKSTEVEINAFLKDELEQGAKIQSSTNGELREARPEWTKPPVLAEFKSQNTESLKSAVDELKKAGVKVSSTVDQNNEVTVELRGKAEKVDKAAEIVAAIAQPVKLEKSTREFNSQLQSNHAAATPKVATPTK